MIAALDLIRWLATLPAGAHVAIDDGGLTLWHVERQTEPDGSYLEIGGFSPEEEEEEAPPARVCDTCGLPINPDEGYQFAADCWFHPACYARVRRLP